MAEVTRKRTGELIRKLFSILIANADGMQARDALATLRGQVTLTDHEKGSYESGGCALTRSSGLQQSML